MNAIFHRVSIRKYEDRPVEQEKIELMLRAAMQAPSATNQQPWEYYVVTNKEVIQKLSKVTPFTKCSAAAPVVFVPCYRNGLRAQMFANIDMSASVENLLLEADELGLGAVWRGISPMKLWMKAVGKILGLPKNLNAFCLIACGYPAESRAQQVRYDEARVHYIK